jgi:hypothetical protein
MPSTTQRGNYYKKKTQVWFEKQGYTVQITEFMCGRMVAPGKIIYVKRDVFGSDGIAMNGEEIIFWNAKHCSTDDKNNIDTQIRQGKKEFASYPFPTTVKRQLVMWQPRKKEPQIIHVT